MEPRNLLKLILIFFMAVYSINVFSKFQVKFTGGTDTPGNSLTENKRGITAATTIKVFLQSGEMLRWSSAFAYSIGTKYSQGEFGVGGAIYPLNSLSKSIVQPYLYVDGFLGLGRYQPSSGNSANCGTGGSSNCELTRMDAGYNLAAGLDIKLLKKYGLTFMIESHSGGEKSLRMLLGFYSIN